MSADPGSFAPKWDREYIRGVLTPETQLRELLAAEGQMLPLNALRGMVATVFSQPIKLSSAANLFKKLVGNDPDLGKRLLATMVRATWIVEWVVHPTFDRPIFIIAAPRSGSNLLFEQLSAVPQLWHIGGESHRIFDRALRHHLRNPEFESHRATALEQSWSRTHAIVDMFTRRLIEGQSGVRLMDMSQQERPRRVRILDKLPKNAFRVSFLNASFPDARFIYLWREPKGNISSLIDAWQEGRRSGRFVTYRQLPGTSFKDWCFVLPPGWRKWVHADLAQIAAFQWASANQSALDDLIKLPHDRWCSVSYRDLTNNPVAELRRICAFSGLQLGPLGALCQPISRLSRTTLTPPSADKWKKNAELIMQILPSVLPVAERIEKITDHRCA